MAWQLCLSGSVRSGVSFQCWTSGSVSPVTGFVSEIAGTLEHLFVWGVRWWIFYRVWNTYVKCYPQNRRLLKCNQKKIKIRYRSTRVELLWGIKAVSGLWHGNWKLKALALQIDCSFWGWISMFSVRLLPWMFQDFALQYFWEIEYHLTFISWHNWCSQSDCMTSYY